MNLKPEGNITLGPRDPDTVVPPRVAGSARRQRLFQVQASAEAARLGATEQAAVLSLQSLKPFS